MMYRPPEMIDKYMKWNVTTKVDIWMLGCVAYTLCYAQHPFQEAQKLAIVNASYYFPTDKVVSPKLQDFIRICLIPNPSERPNVLNLLSLLDNWNQIPQINLPPSAVAIKQKQSIKPTMFDQVKAPKSEINMEEIMQLQDQLRRQKEDASTFKRSTKQHIPINQPIQQTMPV